MSDTLSHKAVQDVLSVNNMRPSKTLGQNFVCDANTIDKIISLASPKSDSFVLEIGPGLGALTIPLSNKSFRVLAIEKDARLAKRLDSLKLPGVKVLAMDAMKINWEKLLLTPWEELETAPISGLSSFLTTKESRCKKDVEPKREENETVLTDWHLVSNLPYNVATQLIISVLEQSQSVKAMLVMLQKEVGLRLCAGAGSRTYGISTLKLSYFADAKIVGKISREVFFPKPNVDSVLVEIKRRDEEEINTNFASYQTISYLANMAFSQRRKMLRHSLKNVLNEQHYDRALLSSTLRPEQLDINAWSRLAKCYNY